MHYIAVQPLFVGRVYKHNVGIAVFQPFQTLFVMAKIQFRRFAYFLKVCFDGANGVFGTVAQHGTACATAEALDGKLSRTRKQIHHETVGDFAVYYVEKRFFCSVKGGTCCRLGCNQRAPLVLSRYYSHISPFTLYYITANYTIVRK
ncbi:unknown [Corallococcus sp. CAG:1435]|nr:unknown [Corallococcus sp. CAG:1435]